MGRVEACLEPVALSELRPTQMTVGFREVAAKRRVFRARSAAERNAFLALQPTPTVLGPDRRHYIIDRHHLTRALFEEGEAATRVSSVADLSHLSESDFWAQMDARRWVHPYDASGRRTAFADLPRTVAELADDPYRSLAAMVRRAGGFAKDRTPYSEFAWADFFRSHLAPHRLSAALAGELGEAIALARAPQARHLPGWLGGA